MKTQNFLVKLSLICMVFTLFFTSCETEEENEFIDPGTVADTETDTKKQRLPQEFYDMEHMIMIVGKDGIEGYIDENGVEKDTKGNVVVQAKNPNNGTIEHMVFYSNANFTGRTFSIRMRNAEESNWSVDSPRTFSSICFEDGNCEDIEDPSEYLEDDHDFEWPFQPRSIIQAPNVTATWFYSKRRSTAFNGLIILEDISIMV